MHYDNATCYSNTVLDSIMPIYKNKEAIILFNANHGEDGYDELLHNVKEAE